MGVRCDANQGDVHPPALGTHQNASGHPSMGIECQRHSRTRSPPSVGCPGHVRDRMATTWTLPARSGQLREAPIRGIRLARVGRHDAHRLAWVGSGLGLAVAIGQNQPVAVPTKYRRKRCRTPSTPPGSITDASEQLNCNVCESQFGQWTTHALVHPNDQQSLAPSSSTYS